MAVQEARNKPAQVEREREAPRQRREGLKEPHTGRGSIMTMKFPAFLGAAERHCSQGSYISKWWRW